MKRNLQLAQVIVLGAVFCATAPAQDQAGSSLDQQPPAGRARQAGLVRGSNACGFQILTQSKHSGPDLGFYPDQVLAAVRRRWYPKIPRDPRSLADPSSAEIDFTILRDGSLRNMNLARSSGNDQLDEAAVQGILAAAPFPPLPAKWREESLAFRFHFFYNEEPSLDRPACVGQGRGGPFHVGQGVTAPHALVQSDPAYAEEARRAKYQGVVILSGTVKPDGEFADVCLEQPLGYGLDEQALAAVKGWKFEPGTKDGEPVPVRISVEISFHLY